MKAFLIVIVLVIGSASYSDEDGPRELYQKAVKLYNLQQYDKALKLFQDAYLLDSQSELLYNIAQTQRALGQNREAIASYQAFLRADPETPLRAEVKTKIADMMLAKEAPQPGATQAPPAVQPSAPQIIVQLPPQAPVLALRPDPPSRSVAGWTLLGVGLLVSGVGAGLLGSAPGVDADARNAMTVAAQEQNTTLANNLRIAGYCVLGTGVVLLIGSGISFGVSGYHYNRGR